MTTTPRDAIAGLSERLRQISEYTGDVADEAASQLDSLLKERDAQAILVQKLQCALAYWLPGVTEAIENETNFRCGDDAQLLAGYEGEFPSECWGDKAIARTDALQARVKELEAEIDQAKDMLGDVPGDTLHHRIDRLIGYYFGLQVEYDRASAAESRATRLQQERDEAYEWLKPFAKDAAKCEKLSPNNSIAHVTTARVRDLRAARDLVRRLSAGPEKIAAANDGEERSTPPEGKI